MAGIVRQVRTIFTAQAGNFRNVTRSMQNDLKSVQKSSQQTTKQMSSDFKSVEGSITPLQKQVTNLQGKIKDGWKDGGAELKRLNTSLEKAQQEFKETGTISEKSMKGLQLSINLSNKDIARLGADGKQSMKEIEQAVSLLKNEMKSVGGSKPFDKVREETRAADKDFGQMRSSLVGLQKELAGIGHKTQSLQELQNAVSAARHEIDTMGKASETTMNRLRKAMQAAGKDTKNFEKLGASGLIGLQNDIIKVEREMNNLGKTSNNVTKNATKGFAQLRKAAMGITTIAAGVGAGLSGAVAFTDQYQASLNQIQMATGASAAETKLLGENIKNVYAANYGQDMQDVAASMAQVKQATGETGTELENLTKYAIGVRDTFGYEVPESTKVANQMMKQFGITGEQAYNLITQGAQQGLDANGDMLDTFNEYSVYFQTLGFDAEGMFNVLKAGSDAGAFNLDKVGDAVKELGIRVKDGSDSSKQAFADLGLNADEMTQKFAKGGESSQKALKEVFNRISEIEDPVKRNSVGVALMGTQFEDLEYKTVAAMGNIKTSVDMNSDALKKMDEVKFNTLGDAFRGIGRAIVVEVIDPIQTKVMPVINGMINNVKANLPQIKSVAADTFGGIGNFIQKMEPTARNLWSALKPIAEVIGITIYGAFKLIESIVPPITNALSFLIAKFTNMKSFVPVMTGIIAAFATFQAYLLAIRTPAMIMQTMATLTRAWGVAQMFLNTTLLANPIGIVIAALAGLAVGLMVAYKRSETFRDIVNKAWSMIKDKAMEVFNFLKPYIEQAMSAVTGFIQSKLAQIKKFWDENGTQIMQAVNNLWSLVKGAFQAAMSVIVPIVQGGLALLKGAFDLVFPLILGIVKSVWGNIQGVINGALNIIMGLVKVFSGLFTGDFSKMWEGIKQIFKGAIEFVWNFIQLNMFGKLIGLGKAFVGPFKGIFTGLWNVLKKLFTASVDFIKNGVVKRFNSLVSTSRSIFNGLRSFFNSTWTYFKTFITKTAQAIWNNVKSQWNALMNGTKNIFNAVRDFLSKLWSGIKNNVSKMATSAKDGVVKAWTTLKTRTTELFNGIKKKVTDIFDDIVGGAKKLPQRIGDGIKSMASGVKKGVKAFANTLVKAMGKGLNGAIAGINWVLEKVDAPTIKEWKIPEYAKGTRNGKHQGGLAWLGDGGEHELYRTPDGKVGLSPNKDTLYNLPKGTEVLSGSQTKEAFNAAGIPAYDGGSGVINGIKDGAKWVGGQVKKKAGQAVKKGAEVAEHAKDKVVDTAKKTKDFALDVWDWMDKPKELMKKVYNKFIPDLPKLGASAGEMLKGGVKKAKDTSIDFITKKLDEFMSFSGGGGDGSSVGAGSGFGGLHPYVEAYYKKIKAKFPNIKFMGGYNNRNVRGGSSKSMHAYGRAFDVGSNPSTMKKIAEYARTTFKDLQYVIYNRKIAGIGRGSKWRGYNGVNPHTDHVHVDFKTGGGGKGTGSVNGVQGWAPYIKRAAAQMKVKVSDYDIQGILAQIKRESHGNEKITQSPSVRDINTRNGNPARGLLQYIPQTFKKYAVKGHGNIYSGFDQLLAWFNNSNWKKDNPRGTRGWGPTGKRRFARGGVISREEEIVAGEDSKREAIIPLDRFKARAIQLFKFVGNELGFDMKSLLSKNASSSLLNGFSASEILKSNSSAYNVNHANASIGANNVNNNVGGVNITMPVEIHGGATKEQADMFVSVALPKIKKELVKEIQKDAYRRGRK